jgi:very-short-patch-repair endonuclease
MFFDTPLLDCLSRITGRVDRRLRAIWVGVLKICPGLQTWVKTMSNHPILQYNSKLKDRARSLRKNMTEAEVKLWVHPRKKQVSNLQFYRQRPIGNYIVDFYCPDAKLIIEVDGGQHFQDEGLEYDEKRDAYLQSLDLTVLRFSNLNVMRNIDGVMDTIAEIVKR